MTERWKRWQDWATVVLGVLLFITPFIFGATGMAAVAWTAYVGGLLLVIAGLWSLSALSMHFTEYSEIVIGVLVFVAPFVLGFTGITYMAWSDWIAHPGGSARRVGGVQPGGDPTTRRPTVKHPQCG